MTQKRAHGARPPRGNRAPCVVAGAHESAQQCFGREHGVGTRHAVAAQQESVCCAGGNEAMEEEAAAAKRKHNLAGSQVFNGTRSDLDHRSRPKRGEHALPVDSQA